MHHLSGGGAPFRRRLCTMRRGQGALSSRRTHRPAKRGGSIKISYFNGRVVSEQSGEDTGEDIQANDRENDPFDDRPNTL